MMYSQCRYETAKRETPKVDSVRTKIQKWGNSLGLRIPKALAEEIAVEEGSSVEIQVKDQSLVISALARRRSDWEPAFDAMAERGDDALLDELPITSPWDEAEWEWK
jgi:antitoxin MazE